MLLAQHHHSPTPRVNHTRYIHTLSTSHKSVSRHFIAMPRRRKNRHCGNHGSSRGDNGGNRSGSGWNRSTNRTMFAASSDPGDLFRARNEQNDVGSSESPITYESLHREVDWLGLKVRAFNDGVAAGRVQRRRRRHRAKRPPRQQRRTLLRPRLHARTTAARAITSTIRPSLMPLVSRRKPQTYKRYLCGGASRMASKPWSPTHNCITSAPWSRGLCNVLPSAQPWSLSCPAFL